MSEAHKIISEIEKSHVVSLAKKDLRLDGRKFNEYRPISIETDYIVKAEGSALVKLGNTQILAGVKVAVGTPFPDTPDEGVVMVNAELIPLASPFFESGPPGETSIEVARVCDRGLRHSEIVDRKKLCIVPGKLVWIIFVDLYVLSFDGNMFDCGEIAAVSALMTTKIPPIEVKDEKVVALGDKNDISKWNHLPIQNLPTSVTVGKITKTSKLILDPNQNEERVIEARITITIDEKDDIVSLQKGSDGFLTHDEIKEAIEMAYTVVGELRSKYPPKPS